MSRAIVLSLGAGVQSSALLLMSDRAEIEKADFAVFADTQAEPRAVYDWLDFLESRVSIPIIRTTAGNIATDVVNGKERFTPVPFFVKNLDGTQGVARRQCTSEYKLDPIRRAVRERLGYLPRQVVKHKVRMLIGISSDEVYRMKKSQDKWVTNVYPLIDRWVSRGQAIEYVEKHLGRTPPRSACFMCPYRSNAEWRHLRATDPDAWAKAVKFDSDIRTQKKFDGESYVHRSMIPLDRVDLTDPHKDQLNMFNNECEGMCGV